MTTASTPASTSDEKLSADLRELIGLHNAIRGDLKGYDCPECRNKGWIYRLDGLYEVARRCACMDVRESIRRMKRSGLFERMQSQTFDTFRTDEPWQKTLLHTAKRYAEKHEMPAFFIGGQQGCGKTHLCTAICVSLLRQGFAVQYYVWETYIKEILTRSGIDDRDACEARMQPLLTCPVLYLDDFLRKDEPSQAERSFAFDVINRRYIDGSITIVSSEHVMDDLARTDPAIAGRIREMCGSAYCSNITADAGKNYRTRKAAPVRTDSRCTDTRARSPL